MFEKTLIERGMMCQEMLEGNWPTYFYLFRKKPWV